MTEEEKARNDDAMDEGRKNKDLDAGLGEREEELLEGRILLDWPELVLAAVV